MYKNRYLHETCEDDIDYKMNLPPTGCRSLERKEKRELLYKERQAGSRKGNKKWCPFEQCRI